MELRPLKRFGGAVLIAATALALVGCKGDTGPAGATGATGQQGATGQTGQQGATGQTGPQGSNGQTGPAGMIAPINIANMTTDQWAATTLTGSITSVDLTQTTPVVKFSVATSAGTPVAGLSNASTTVPLLAATTPTVTQNPVNPNVVTTYPNFAFSIAKLVTGPGGTTTWVDYLVDTTPSSSSVAGAQIAPTHPSTEANGKLTEDGYGNYVYTFARNIQKESAWLNSLPASTWTGTLNPTTGSSLTGTFLADLDPGAYDNTATHRIGIRIGGPFPGTGSNTVNGSTEAPPTVLPGKTANLMVDFVPGTTNAWPNTVAHPADRHIVDVSVCNNCHTVLGGGASTVSGTTGGVTNLAFHSGEMNDPNFCVFCHNEQLKYKSTDGWPGDGTTTMAYTTSSTKVNGLSTGNTVEWIHKFHMGVNLKMANNPQPLMNTGWYPQDIRRCDTCHQAVTNTAGVVVNPQWQNYQTVPSREACGSCHDAVDFATGNIANGTATPAQHGNGIAGSQTDDSQCTKCHSQASIQVYHTPMQSPAENQSNGTNSHAAGGTTNTWQAASMTNMPAGALYLKYVINSVGVSKTLNPVINFQILYSTTPFSATNPGTPMALNTTQPANLAGQPATYIPSTLPLTGGPTLGIQAGISQDGILQPTDYNVNKETEWTLQALYSGKATLGPKGATVLVSSQGIQANTAITGGYTVTLDGVTLPSLANCNLVGLGLGWTPFIQMTAMGGGTLTPASGLATLDNEGAVSFGNGLQLPAQNVWADVNTTTSTTPGYSARRTIIAENACSSCHGDLGVFTPNTTAANNYASNFHNGYMNDPQHCVFCHTTGGTSGGWSYNAKTWVHGIHSAGFRSTTYAVQANFPLINYPGVLNDCEACHVPGSYDFSNTTNQGQVANMLWDTNAVGYYPAQNVINTTGAPAGTIGGTTNYTFAPTTGGGYAIPAALSATVSTTNGFYAPWIPTPAGQTQVNYVLVGTTVTKETTYSGLTVVPATGVPAVATPAATGLTPAAANGTVTYIGSYSAPGTPSTANAGWWVVGANATTLTQPDPNRLVTSPLTAACTGCHDSQASINHMVTTGGGVFYQPANSVPTARVGGNAGASQTTAAYPVLQSTENCLSCHGAGTVADIHAVHMNFSGANGTN